MSFPKLHLFGHRAERRRAPSESHPTPHFQPSSYTSSVRVRANDPTTLEACRDKLHVDLAAASKLTDPALKRQAMDKAYGDYQSNALKVIAKSDATTLEAIRDRMHERTGLAAELNRAGLSEASQKLRKDAYQLYQTQSLAVIQSSDATTLETVKDRLSERLSLAADLNRAGYSADAGSVREQAYTLYRDQSVTLINSGDVSTLEDVSDRLSERLVLAADLNRAGYSESSQSLRQNAYQTYAQQSLALIDGFAVSSEDDAHERHGERLKIAADVSRSGQNELGTQIRQDADLKLADDLKPFAVQTKPAPVAPAASTHPAAGEPLSSLAGVSPSPSQPTLPLKGAREIDERRQKLLSEAARLEKEDPSSSTALNLKVSADLLLERDMSQLVGQMPQGTTDQINAKRSAYLALAKRLEAESMDGPSNTTALNLRLSADLLLERNMAQLVGQMPQGTADQINAKRSAYLALAKRLEAESMDGPSNTTALNLRLSADLLLERNMAQLVGQMPQTTPDQINAKRSAYIALAERLEKESLDGSSNTTALNLRETARRLIER